MFRWLIVPIGKNLEEPSKALSLGLACMTLPFVLFAPYAGYLADRFSKRSVMIACKVAEILTMILGVAAILSGNVYAMFAVLFLMGTQAAIFGPSKYGSIPEIVREDRISAANGVIGMTTMVAIIAGHVGRRHPLCRHLGARRAGRGLRHVSLVDFGRRAARRGADGWCASLFIGRLRPADPTRRFPLGAGRPDRPRHALAGFPPGPVPRVPGQLHSSGDWGPWRR